MYGAADWCSQETECLSCLVSNRTAKFLYKYCTNCTTWYWNILTVITQKLLLPDHLHNRKRAVKPKFSAVEFRLCFEIVCIYRESYREFWSFKLTLLSENVVSQFFSDKEQVDVTKITNKMCKLKATWSNVNVKCWFVWIFSELFELWLERSGKYLAYYSKGSIYITVLHLAMTGTTTFHNNQSTSVPISVIYVDINEHNSGTGTVRRIAGQ